MKERIKSFVLAGLVILCIGLTSITWIDERLWPDGYSLFANVKELPVIRLFFSDSYSLPMENLSNARKIVIADGLGSSAVFYNGDKTYNAVYEDIEELMVKLLNGEIKAKSTSSLIKENVREVLNEQILYAYVNYSVAMPPSFYGQLMGVENSDVFPQDIAVRDFFILPTGDESLELLAIDNESENVMRYELEYEDTSELIAKFTEYVSSVSADNSCVMALQMNMDVASPDDAVQMKTLLDSFLVLDSASTADSEKPEIISRNALENEIPEDVILSFSYNPNSIHRYVDSNGTVVYLENDSSLKFYKNGVVEFEAVEKDYGIDLDSGVSLYESLNSAIRFAGKVYSAATSDGTFNMNVSEDIRFEQEGEMKFSFDYYCNGTPVATLIDFDGDLMQHAAEVVVSEGKITYFRMLIREYEVTAFDNKFMNIYGAIDKIAAEHEDAEAPVKIEDMFPAYKENGNSERLTPCWVGYAEGRRIILTEN